MTTLLSSLSDYTFQGCHLWQALPSQCPPVLITVARCLSPAGVMASPMASPIVQCFCSCTYSAIVKTPSPLYLPDSIHPLRLSLAITIYRKSFPNPFTHRLVRCSLDTEKYSIIRVWTTLLHSPRTWTSSLISVYFFTALFFIAFPL